MCVFLPVVLGGRKSLRSAGQTDQRRSVPCVMIKGVQWGARVQNSLNVLDLLKGVHISEGRPLWLQDSVPQRGESSQAPTHVSSRQWPWRTPIPAGPQGGWTWIPDGSWGSSEGFGVFPVLSCHASASCHPPTILPNVSLSAPCLFWTPELCLLMFFLFLISPAWSGPYGIDSPSVHLLGSSRRSASAEFCLICSISPISDS